MKKNFKIISLILCSTLLTGCSLFAGKVTHIDETPYEYTAADIRYYTDANQQICSLSSNNTTRIYYKAYDGFCAVALANIGNYCGPVLIAEDDVQVCFKTNYSNDVIQCGGSVEVNGKTYYYSTNTYFVSGNLDGKKNYGNYFSKYTTLADVARDIAAQAEFVPVDESLKNVYSYSVKNDGTLSVKAGPYFVTVEKAVLPSEIDGKTVTEISSYGFKGLPKLKEVILPAGITKVGSYAFSECSQLYRAYVPSSVTSIGDYAFYKNAADLYVFCGATSKPSGYNTSWAYSAKYTAYGMKRYGENDDYLYGELIDGTLHLSLYKGNEIDVVVPDTIENKSFSVVGGHAFYENESLRTITLPSTIVEIRQYAFSKCYLLNNVVLPYGVTTIGPYVFRECSKLNRAYIPSSVTTIGEYAFYKNAADLYVFCGVTSKPSGYNTNWAYSANSIIYGVKNYGESDDFLYSELIDGTLHLSLYKGTDENVIIPETINGKTVSVIGGSSFKNNTTMKSISLPSTIVEIRNSAFLGCQLLKEIKIPYGVTTLGPNVFRECPKLERAYVPSSVTTIGEYTFYKDSADLRVFCGATSKPSGYNTYWAYSAKTVTWKSSGYIDHGDNVYNIQLSSRNLTLVGYKKNADGVVSMPEDGIIEHNGEEYRITSIGTAFKGDTLVYSVNMPYTLKTIPSNAFDGCTNLSFVFDFTQTDVTYIGDYAFKNTKLSEMHLPRSMDYIGEGAFFGTTFTTLYYSGSVEDWNSIGKSDGGLVEFILHQSWRKGSSITQVTCIGGTIYF